MSSGRGRDARHQPGLDPERDLLPRQRRRETEPERRLRLQWRRGEGFLYVDGDLRINRRVSLPRLIYAEGDVFINGNCWILAHHRRRKTIVKSANGSATICIRVKPSSRRSRSTRQHPHHRLARAIAPTRGADAAASPGRRRPPRPRRRALDTARGLPASCRTIARRRRGQYAGPPPQRSGTVRARSAVPAEDHPRAAARTDRLHVGPGAHAARAQ